MAAPADVHLYQQGKGIGPMGSLGAAMDRGRGDGSGTAKRRPAARRLLPCWLPRPIAPAASCSACLTGASVRRLD